MTFPTHFERHRLVLTPLTPIHIGSGESIEPFEYDVELRDGYGILNVYDLDQLLPELTTRQRAEFDRLAGANWHEMRDWLRKQFQEKHLKFRRAIEEKAALELSQTLNNRNRTGQIDLLPRNEISQLAYLPGSSIKGAIRTALLDAAVQSADASKKRELQNISHQLTRTRNRSAQQRAEQQFQQVALDYKNANDDPFRQLAISDFTSLHKHTGIYLIQIINAKKEDQQAGNILIFREVTKSKVVDPKEEILFESELRLFPQLTDSCWKEKSITRKITRKMSWEQICADCNEFYQPRLQNELEVHTESKMYRDRLKQAADAIKQNECLIRVGRHSHFECVTVSAPYHHSPQKGYGKSRSYVSGRAPLGWAKLSLLPPLH